MLPGLATGICRLCELTLDGALLKLLSILIHFQLKLSMQLL